MKRDFIKRIRPTLFLGRLERVREEIPMEKLPDFLPQTTWKSYGNDAQGRIRPTLFLEQLERVREEIPMEESVRLPSSDNPKGLWKGYPGKNPPDSLPRTTRKG
jgi:hypothetical protein